MDSDAFNALLESLKLINTNLEKLSKRLDVLEEDYKERSVKKRLFKFLFAFYPVVLVVLLFLVDSDHHKIAEIAGDLNELIQDGRSLVMYANNEDN